MEKRAEAVKLFEGNTRLANHIAGRYMRTFPGLSEDIAQAALLGLWQAALAFDPGRGSKFSSFAGTCILNDILLLLRRETTKRLPTVSLDALRGEPGEEWTLLGVLSCPDSSREVEDREIERQVREVAPLVAEWALDRRTQRQIAATIGCSQPQASRLIAQQAERVRELCG